MSIICQHTDASTTKEITGKRNHLQQNETYIKKKEIGKCYHNGNGNDEYEFI